MSEQKLTDEELAEAFGIAHDVNAYGHEATSMPRYCLERVCLLVVEQAEELRALRAAAAALSDADRKALGWLASNLRRYTAECARDGREYDIRHTLAQMVLDRLLAQGEVGGEVQA